MIIGKRGLFPEVGDNEGILMVSGVAWTIEINENGKEVASWIFYPGDYIRPHILGIPVASIEAATDVEIRVISCYEKEWENYQGNLEVQLKRMNVRLNRSNQRLENKISGFLAEIVENEGFIECEEGYRVNLTQTEIAQAVGSSRESTTKSLGSIARNGNLRLGYGYVIKQR